MSDETKAADGPDPDQLAGNVLAQVNELMVGRTVQRVGIDPETKALCVEVQGGHVLMLYGVESIGMGRTA